MINHLTEDQIAKWLVGQATAAEQHHVHDCRTCAGEVTRFQGTLESFRSAVNERAERMTLRSSRTMMQVLEPQPWTLLDSPSLFSSLKRIVIDTLYPPSIRTSVPPAEVKELWSKTDVRMARRLSLAGHVFILVLLILPAAITGTLPSTQTLVDLYKSVPLILDPPQVATSGGGGGGGGRQALTPPSKGSPPRGAERQIVPPMVETRNLAPDLVVESTIIAPQFETLQALNVAIGDPNGIVGPPSPGPGRGGGVGTGNGTGVGDGNGPGFGPGSGGGRGGGSGPYSVGGGVSEPALISQIPPDYSDDARKARIEGTVELLIVIRADGSVQFDSVTKSLGFGLDQNAIAAVKQWKFRPGRRDGQPVPVWMSVIVNFTIR
jgi:TonB family protein